ncbi:hypothetical protein [Ramlibacter humi]|uniref:hypothetical protein n=1 Tax=Ramlibacter humi TaxID=2530451 RepID=UPI00143060DE|nr:hypothetical protein [Ramlibacter humi]
MDFDDDFFALLALSLALAALLASWARRRNVSPRRQVRRMMGAGALFGAAALMLLD